MGLLPSVQIRGYINHTQEMKESVITILYVINWKIYSFGTKFMNILITIINNVI